MLWPLYCGPEAPPDEIPGLEDPCCVFAAAAALLAAHLAFIAAASCARRSGVRLSFLFTFFAPLGLSTAAGCVRAIGAKRRSSLWIRSEALTVLPALPARAADFFFFFAAPVVAAASSFCFSLASFVGPSRRRFSSRRIFFFKFFSFMMCAPVCGKGE